MKNYRVITDLHGRHCLQGRRPFLRFLWRTIALGGERASLDFIRSRMEAGA